MQNFQILSQSVASYSIMTILPELCIRPCFGCQSDPILPVATILCFFIINWCLMNSFYALKSIAVGFNQSPIFFPKSVKVRKCVILSESSVWIECDLYQGKTVNYFYDSCWNYWFEWLLWIIKPNIALNLSHFQMMIQFG